MRRCICGTRPTSQCRRWPRSRSSARRHGLRSGPAMTVGAYRLSQFELLDLSCRGLRQTAEGDEPRTFEVRQMHAAPGDDVFLRGALHVRLERDEGMWSLAPLIVGLCYHSCLHYVGVLVKHLLHFQRADVLASGDDDILRPVLD